MLITGDEVNSAMSGAQQAVMVVEISKQALDDGRLCFAGSLIKMWTLLCWLFRPTGLGNLLCLIAQEKACFNNWIQFEGLFLSGTTLFQAEAASWLFGFLARKPQNLFLGETSDREGRLDLQT